MGIIPPQIHNLQLNIVVTRKRLPWPQRVPPLDDAIWAHQPFDLTGGMGRSKSPQELVATAAGMCAAGVIGPAEMWGLIERALNTRNASEVLDSCPPGVRQLLARSYIEMPWLLGSGQSRSRKAIRAVVATYYAQPPGRIPKPPEEEG